MANSIRPVYVTPQIRRFPLECCNGSGTQKLELYPYQTVENYDDISVYTQYWHLTDRQAELLNSIALRMHCWLTRDKN